MSRWWWVVVVGMDLSVDVGTGLRMGWEGFWICRFARCLAQVSLVFVVALLAARFSGSRPTHTSPTSLTLTSTFPQCPSAITSLGNPAETCGSSYVASTYILLSSGGSSDGTSTVFSTRTTTVTTTLTTITSASTSSAAASPSSSSSSVASGWTYLGCSQDGSLRALTGYSVDLGSSATIAGCLRVCAGKGYGMAGIQYGSQ